MTSENLESTSKDILNVSIEDEMQRSYLDYAMSVIVSRALPDVRDGLKPVHRRILYAMDESGFDYNKPYRKSARVSGSVMGKYHPHGNVPIYDAMVRMAQDFSMRVPLIDGQGNFGSIDGDPPAAERYTEARLERVARYLLDDIEKDTVDFTPNYDDTSKEPVVLPARFPNLLVNGGSGIAVGMATNIPPHNLGEVIDGCCAFIDNPEMTVEDLLQHIPGPDFPTGGIILGRSGIYSAHKSGRGSIVMRGKARIEEIRKDKEAIIITEIPYQVNKTRMLERMAEVVKQKIIEGITDLRDESDRDGLRVVVELRKDAVAEVVLNQLYRYTPLQTSFGVNSLALDHGVPKVMTVLEVIRAFVRFREEVITRRVKFDLNKARNRAHVLVGLAVAVANIDEMIQLIKTAPDPNVARERMLEKEWAVESIASLIELVAEPGYSVVDGKYRLSETQARAILDLKLHRLTGLERDKISDELNKLIDQIKEYLAILASREKLLEIMKDELIEVKEQFATPRRTEIEDSELNVDLEDLIQREQMVVTVSQGGYIKRVPLSTYRAQRRGGKGRSGMSTRDEDIVSDVIVVDTHTPLVFFSSRGICYSLKVYRLPIGTPTSLGKAMVNILPLTEGETISTVLPLRGEEDELKEKSIVFATASGNIRRNALSDFMNIKSNGKIAMKLDEGDSLIGVRTCDQDQDVLLTTKQGKCIRFAATDVRLFVGRNSTGVRGLKLAQDDEIISMSMLTHSTFNIEERDEYLKVSRMVRSNPETQDQIMSENLDALSRERFDALAAQEQFILSVTDRGFGKRTSAYEYRVTNRGGLGFANMDLTEKNGTVVGSFVIEESDQIVLVTDGGQLIRCPIHDVRIAGRVTQGVTLFRVSADENVVSVARIAETDDDDNGEESESESSSAESTAEGTTGSTNQDNPQKPESETSNPEGNDS